MSKPHLDEERSLKTERKRHRPDIRQSHLREPNSRIKFSLILLGIGLLCILVVLAIGTYLLSFSFNERVSPSEVSFSEALISFFLVVLFILLIAGLVSLAVRFVRRSKQLKRFIPISQEPIPQDEAAWARRMMSLYSSLHDESSGNSTILSIRIIEDPLTAQNVATLMSAFTEFYVKCWLIAQKRLADLIEYTQTHNIRFSNEAGLIIAKISYNSPLNVDWKVDISVQGLAEAIATAIDGVTQVRSRLEKAELENRVKEQEIKQAAQKAEQEIQTTLLGNEKAALEIEKQRLELLEKRLDVQKKGIEYALEIAGKTVDALHPSADAETRAMIIQTLLPNILQFQNGKGLELALPAPQNGKNDVTEEK